MHDIDLTHSIRRMHTRATVSRRFCRLFSMAGLLTLLLLVAIAIGALASGAGSIRSAVMGIIILWGLLGLRYLLTRH